MTFDTHHCTKIYSPYVWQKWKQKCYKNRYWVICKTIQRNFFIPNFCTFLLYLHEIKICQFLQSNITAIKSRIYNLTLDTFG